MKEMSILKNLMRENYLNYKTSENGEEIIILEEELA